MENLYVGGLDAYEKNKNILIYDIGQLPQGITMAEIVKKYKKENVVIWCSAAHANMSGKHLPIPPIICNKDDIKEFKFINTSEL